MANCHEADTDLRGMIMEEKKEQTIFLVIRNKGCVTSGETRRAYTFLEEAQLCASRYPDAEIKEVKLIYNTTNKFYAGDDPL